jgi:hypothetical protein
MDKAPRMEEARRRQSIRGRLRWLLDDFSRLDLNVPLRPGELLDLGDDVRAFADADDQPEPTQDGLRQIQQETLAGLTALFNETGPRPWPLGRVPVELGPTRDPRELAWVRSFGVLDRKETRITRLLVPHRLHLAMGKEPLNERFTTAAALEVMNGGRRVGKEWRSLVGRCPECWRFFYVDRRQIFCSLRCKQEAMDERKAERRSGVSIQPRPGPLPKQRAKAARKKGGNR